MRVPRFFAFLGKGLSGGIFVLFLSYGRRKPAWRQGFRKSDSVKIQLFDDFALWSKDKRVAKTERAALHFDQLSIFNFGDDVTDYLRENPTLGLAK